MDPPRLADLEGAMDGPTGGWVRGNRTITRGEPGLNHRTRTQKVNGNL